MGTYMRVVLKPEYQQDTFISELNELLGRQYGANIGVVFNTWAFLKEEENFLNNDPQGLKMIPHFQRPITKEFLHENFVWYRMGEFLFKLSGEVESQNARDAVAVCKWIRHTRARFIDTTFSFNYRRPFVSRYLDPVFIEDGYDLTALWQLPSESK